MIAHANQSGIRLSKAYSKSASLDVPVPIRSARLTRIVPVEFPERLRKNNHLGDEIWFKKRTMAEKSEVVGNFSDQQFALIRCKQAS
jgi:hypothetical protein